MLIALFDLPLIGGFAILLLGYSRRFKRLAPPLTLVILLATLISTLLMTERFFKEGSALYSMGGFPGPIGIDLRLDGPAILGSLIGLVVIFLATCFAFSQGGYGALFYGIILLLTASMQAVLLSNDIFNLYVYLEVLSICTYFLIAYQQRTKALKATLDYLLISSLAFAFYIIGVAILYKTTGVLGLQSLALALSKEGMQDNQTVRFALALILTGIGVKTAFFPLHTWLPDAHAQAPAPVSAILSAVMIKVSFLSMWRIIIVLHRADFMTVMLWAGVASALFGGVLALIQVDIKRLLACSSISQIGFIIAAFGSANVWGEIGSAFHLVNHAIFKSLLFLCAGIIVARTGKRNLREISGLRAIMPVTSLIIIIGAFSIAGVPGFNGFVSKVWIEYSLDQMPIPYWSLTLAGVLSVAYMLRFLSILWGPRYAGNSPTPDKDKKHPHSILLAPAVLAVLCLLTGLWPEGTERPLRSLLDFPLINQPNNGVYTLLALGKSFMTILAGVFLYLILKTRIGVNISDRLRQIQLTLNGKLFLVVIAALGFYCLALMGGPQ